MTAGALTVALAVYAMPCMKIKLKILHYATRAEKAALVLVYTHFTSIVTVLWQGWYIPDLLVMGIYLGLKCRKKQEKTQLTTKC